MDFFTIKTKTHRNFNTIEVYPEFLVDKSKDLMVRGNDFYAFWDEEASIWKTDRLAIQKKIDHEIKRVVSDVKKNESDKKKANEDYVVKTVTGMYLKDFSTNQWVKFNKYVQSIKDNYVQLDTELAFADTVVTKDKYISRKLPYSIIEGDYSAWDHLVGTLYDPEEREKIEWAIGAILSGDSKKIQKFLVFYGPQGSGKSTILEIIMKMFDGYCETFKVENLVKGNDQFNLDFLGSNPLVTIDTDSRLDRIESNATLNKLVSHEQLQVNEKFKNRYPVTPACMVLLGTNHPVKITDAKSGIIRRLIDIEPSGRLIPEDEYFDLLEKINYELGAIAFHCLSVYKRLKKNYYSKYIPERMMYRTDPFFNFMDERVRELFYPSDPKKESIKGLSATQIWAMWKDYCSESGIDDKRQKYKIVDEAKNYFESFKKSTTVDDISVRSWFSDLKSEKFGIKKADQAEESISENINDKPSVNKDSYGWLKLNKTKSLLDDILKDCPAQYEITDETGNKRPDMSWKRVKTKLKDLDTTKTHYVKGPGQLIFMDFDLRGEDGEKSLERNLKEAGSSRWPKTYAEVSNSGAGIHGYYWYDGNVNDLSSMLDEHIEIKVFPEDQLRSMRRRVSLCNDLPIAHISSGLPLKEKKVINWEGVKDDRHLRNMILQALKKECRPYGEEPKTTTCVKYIADLLKMAQESGMSYDIRDLGEAIYAFAANSHNNKEDCINRYYAMELVWPKQIEQSVGAILDDKHDENSPIIILDCEVVPNLTLVVYKELEPDGKPAILKPNGPDKKCVRLYNPKPHEVEKLMEMRIVGHNVVGYDNYILYALWMGYTPEQVHQLSQDIIVHGNRTPWREAKNLSYTDTLDVSSDKKGLKKIEIEMHLPHKEMETDWSKPLPESEWERLAQYCENDVLATEAYFMSKGWQSDFKARKILAALTGMSVNDSTNNLTAQLIFGDVREPWTEFVYPDLKAEFPEYRFEKGKSYYLDELIGEGGRVYAEPGIYEHTITFDVAGMHPISIISEKGFGRFTKNYQDLYEARIAIKHKDYDKARNMFGGRLAPYLQSDDDADALSHALKIALNSVYGMTAAHFQNRFKDPRNVDNWVAKRGALFMEKLRLAVQKRGGHVIHIKTDSIKLVQPSQELQDFVVNFGKEHGYTFEVESKYERICLVNHAVYIALREKDDPSWLKECDKARKKAEKEQTEYREPTRWTATGAQFAHPYVFKRLFSREPMDFWDYCETKTVKTALYLDMNEKLPDVTADEKELVKIQKRIKMLNKELTNPEISAIDREKIENEIRDLQKDIEVLNEDIAKGHHYMFVGKAGEFMPIKDGMGGGLLMRSESDGGYGYATGAKGYRWLESETLHILKDWKRYIDLRYFKSLVDAAIDTIGKYGDFNMFIRGVDSMNPNPDNEVPEYNDEAWWNVPCGSEQFAYCNDCPDFINKEDGYFCKRGYVITEQNLGE